MTLWHGRFDDGPSDELLAFTVSLPFDQRLAADDIAGRAPTSAAWPAPGSCPTRRRRRARRARPGRGGAGAGTFAFQPTDEDIHTAVERRVTELAGPAGAKLHTGRSRNDQVATDLRLYTKRELTAVARRVARPAARAAEPRADDAGDTYLPGYTHLQRAQPVLLAHHLLAHGWALARDVDRLARLPPAARRVAAGRRRAGGVVAAARSRGHRRRPRVRGRVRELARRGERPRLRRRGAVRPRPARRAPVAAWARRSCCGRPRSSASSASPTRTRPGSSMLPQKKNPDIAELVRGKAGRLIGDLTGLLATLKGLPALVQPRPPRGQGAAVRRGRPGAASASTALCRPAARPLGSTSTACRPRPTSPTSAATDLAELLVDRGMPFRDAHALVGALVRDSVERRVPLVELVAAHPDLGGGRGRAARARRGGVAPHDPRRCGPAPVERPVPAVPQAPRSRHRARRVAVAPVHRHEVRIRYGEVDMQRVVFNAHYLAYCDDAADIWFRSLGMSPASDWDAMVKQRRDHLERRRHGR